MTKVSVRYGGHTFMYTYRDGEESRAVAVVTSHVANGRLAPVAGIVLCEMISGEKG